ncbi:MAG: site-specific integrase [Ruminococcus sp.]|nr:site-specific integrase [Ruminococcus sp.]
MATAKQLPSGSWRVQVYDKELKKTVSFTSKLPGKSGKAEAELMAREYQLGLKKKRILGKTVGECIDEYIDLKENILSPTTVAEYRRCRKNELGGLCGMYVKDLTANDIQAHMNKLSLTMKPKTVRNAHGLLVAAMNIYAPDLRIRTTLPKVQKKIKQLPKAEDVLRCIIGSKVELPCLLAMWCTLRMSEVRGIKKTDIKDNILTIHETKVRVHNADVLKSSTKTVESTRLIRLPAYIQELVNALPEEQEFITNYTGQNIYKRFTDLLKKNGVEHMSFHDLRHMNASIMHMLGVPDKYAMERGGWSSDSVLKSVYQHTFSKEREEVDDKIDDYFNKLLDDISHENSHESKNGAK